MPPPNPYYYVDTQSEALPTWRKAGTPSYKSPRGLFNAAGLDPDTYGQGDSTRRIRFPQNPILDSSGQSADRWGRTYFTYGSNLFAENAGGVQPLLEKSLVDAARPLRQDEVKDFMNSQSASAQTLHDAAQASIENERFRRYGTNQAPIDPTEATRGKLSLITSQVGLQNQGLQNLINTRQGARRDALALAGQLDEQTIGGLSGLLTQASSRELAQASKEASKDAAKWGAIGTIGSLGLSAAALFPSDRRLKHSIERIGALPSGLPVYSFVYIWGQPALGVMADEVAQVFPHAVGYYSSGYAYVNYAEIF